MQPSQVRELPFVVEVRPRRRPLWAVVAFATLVGVALGVFDRWAQHVLPYPAANLANSAAIWAVVAFAVGLWVAHHAWHAAVAGVLTLVVAVVTYYGASAAAYGDDLGVLTARSTQLWLGFAVVVGALLGAAGAWARNDDSGVRALGLALAPSVLFAETLNLLRIGSRPGGDAVAPGSTALLEFGAGLAVLGALAVFVARDRRDRLAALACTVPISLIGFGLYAAAAYGG